MRFPSFPFTVLDTETTGFLPRTHRVIEFASVQVRDGKVMDEYEQLFSIDEPLPPIIRAITHIHDEDLQGQPSFAERREEILKHIGTDTLIVGQNIPYDIGMLNGENVDLSERPWIDTSMLASLVFPESHSYSLGHLSATLGLNHTPVHRALGDVHATLELLEKIWERLLEIPEEDRLHAQSVMQRSSEGYRLLFDALPKSTQMKRPQWLKMPTKKPASSIDTIECIPPEKGRVQLLEESRGKDVLPLLLKEAEQHTGKHLIAVKNLEASVQNIAVPQSCRVISPAFLILDPDAVERLRAQDTLTPDEATVLLKIDWYAPRTQAELPLHGDERSVWSGKLACTHESKAYCDQFTDAPNAVLMDHRQLLAILATPDHPGRILLEGIPHLVLTEATMLEDTATKAFGFSLSVDDLRAAAQGDDALMRFADSVQLWIERTRNALDVRYISVSDLREPSAFHLREQLEQLLQNNYPSQTQLLFTHLQQFLVEDTLKDNIVFIEQQRDRQFLRVAPQSVEQLLSQHVYGEFPVTLIVPPGSKDSLPGILPHTFAHTFVEGEKKKPLHVQLEKEVDLLTFLQNPLQGKTVVLSPSKRSIEELFVKHAEQLQNRGVAVFCQGMSGGMNRMCAEFLDASAPALWALTPWSYEGVDLPAGTIDQLVLAALPFDHPSHAVLSRRAEKLSNAFEGYFLPRLEMRLLRILRTFALQSKDTSRVLVLDKRIFEKSYGERVQALLLRAADGATEKDVEMDATQLQLF